MPPNSLYECSCSPKDCPLCRFLRGRQFSLTSSPVSLAGQQVVSLLLIAATRLTFPPLNNMSLDYIARYPLVALIHVIISLYPLKVLAPGSP